MKKRNYFVPIFAIAMGGFLSGCIDSDKDLYNPSYQTPNPMGADFAAPEGFDWSTTRNLSVEIEVKDEESGLYNYQVEIYDANPLYTEDAQKLAGRIANKENSFKVTAEIEILPGQKNIFVKQTDPRGRVEVYPLELSEGQTTLTAKLYYQAAPTSQLRAAISRSVTTRAGESSSLGTKPDYTTIPADAKELKDVANINMTSGASYKITSDYSGGLTNWGNSGAMIKLYIAPGVTWNIPAQYQDGTPVPYAFQTGLEIILMAGAKINAPTGIIFAGNSSLTIMDNATATVDNITFANGLPAALRNWGTLKVTQFIKLNAGAVLYSKGEISANTFEVSTNSEVINDYKLSLRGDLILPSDVTLTNNGEIYGKHLEARGTSKLTNNSTMKFESIFFNNTTVINACSMEATTTFKTNVATMNFVKGYVKASVMELVGTTFNLSNGSMIDATTSLDWTYAACTITGTGENPSMVRAPKITGQGFTYQGNLVVESDNHVEKNQWWDNFHVKSNTRMTKIGESKVVVEVCTGIKNEGNPGTDPKNTNYIQIDDKRNYAYLFEDQWPLYGDYDMNDVVLILKERVTVTNAANKVEEFSMTFDLAATGATKSIAAAVMLDNVPASAVSAPVVYRNESYITGGFSLNGNKTESGQDNVVIPLFSNAHETLDQTQQLQVNTLHTAGALTANAKTLSFTVKFSEPVAPENLKLSQLNVFIIVDGNKASRKEIHIAGFKPTKHANTSLFGGNNDASSLSQEKYYISHENLAWGIMVPTHISWPLEYVNIKTAYNGFEGWVTSAGKENGLWWQTPTKGKVFFE